MVSDVLQDSLRNFTSGLTVQGDKHALAEGFFKEPVNKRRKIAGKRLHVLNGRHEPERCGKFKQEPYMKIAVIGLHGIQKQDTLPAPVKKARFIGPVPDRTVKDLAHEHSDSILVKAVPDTRQMTCKDRSGSRIQA